MKVHLPFPVLREDMSLCSFSLFESSFLPRSELCNSKRKLLHVWGLVGCTCTCLMYMVGFAFLQAGLVPGSYVGMGNNGTGCFTRGTGVSMGRCSMTARHTWQSTHCRASCMAVPMHAAHWLLGPLQASQKALSLT